MTSAALDLQTSYYVTEWVIRIGALIIVPLRRAPAATRAWLLLIFFLPVPGLLLFLAIGSPRFPAWRKERFARLLPFFAQIADRLKPFVPALGGQEPIAALAATLGHMPATGGNRVELIDDYDSVIDRLVADIDAARESVRLLVYIYADDAVGRRIAAALAGAVARGVDCRVMFDPVGSRPWRKRTLRLLREAGVIVREALPFRFIRGRTRRDMRNHRKLFVIDGAVGYAGSLNIVSKQFRSGIVNRELVARVAGPVVASMAAVVRGDWFLETADASHLEVAIPQVAGEAVAQLLPSGADYPLEGFQSLLVWQLHQARESVVIVTPYFVPDEDVLGAMRTAVQRGVRVDLIVSAVIDQRIVNLSQSSYYDGLLSAGVQVHLFRRFLLHTKALRVDRRLAVVGSSNVDVRSFQLNEEASILFYDSASIAALCAIQQHYLDGCDTLDLGVWRQRPALRKLAENIARLVNSLL